MRTLSVDLGLAVMMADGVRLATDIYRPAGPGRYPVVLLRTPYGRANPGAFALQVNAPQLANAGFAVVVQDVRGRFESEGDFWPFQDEARDGVATIEWAAEQSWSTGAVAMAGMSYCGYIQALAARERPDALRAWMPAFCPLDARDDWAYDGDALRLAFGMSWAMGTLAPGDRAIRDPERVRDAFDDWQATVERTSLDLPELEGTSLGETWRDWLARPDDATWWDSQSGRGAGLHDAPTLVVGGWFDLFQHGTFALHEELTQSSAPTQLLVGPWDHSPCRCGQARVTWTLVPPLGWTYPASN